MLLDFLLTALQFNLVNMKTLLISVVFFVTGECEDTVFWGGFLSYADSELFLQDKNQ